MPEQIRKPVREQTQKEKQEEATALADADAAKQAEIRAKGEETISDIDDLLDAIDAVLEINAEEFVKAYRQKGGE